MCELAHVAAVSGKTHRYERAYRFGLCVTPLQGDNRQELLLQSAIDLFLVGTKQLIRVPFRQKRNHIHRIEKCVSHGEICVLESIKHALKNELTIGKFQNPHLK